MKGLLIKILAPIVLIAALAGGYTAYQKWSRLVDVGGVRIDPAATIDPDREYHLVVWENEVPLPWDAGSHQAQFVAAVEEFKRAWPNISIDIKILPWNENHVQLKEALARGDAPDVVGMPMGVFMMSDERQVPIDGYMSSEARKDTMPVSLRSLSDDGHVWAWPRWVLPSQWVLREDMAPSLEVARNSWSTADFINVIHQATEKSQAVGIVLNPFDGRLFFELMVASTGKNMIDAQGNRTWSEEEIKQGVEFIQSLITEKLTRTNAESMSRSRLEDFWNMKAASIAPVNPWLMRHLLTRGGVVSSPSVSPEEKDLARHLVLPTAIPSLRSETAGKYQPASVSGYVVFRREPHQGDDHTKAAMMLAEHLSRRLGPWEAAQLFAVPVHPSAWEHWRADSGLPQKETDLLIEWAQMAIAPPIDEHFETIQRRAVEEIIPSEIIKLWQGASVDDVTRNIVQNVDGLYAMAKATATKP